MPTVETWTVGTGGDYSTPQLAEDALPASLVADDKQIDIALFNQEWTVAGTVLTLAGVTTDATRYVRVIAYARPDITELPLRYNTSAGPCLRATVGYTVVVSCSINYTKFVGIQISGPTDASGIDVLASYVEFYECLISAFWRNVNATGNRNGLKACNTVFVKPFNGGNYPWYQDFGTATIDNCTIVRPSNHTVANTVFYNNYFTLTVRNTVVTGFTNFSDSTPGTSSNNAGSMASVPGSGSLNSLTATDLFEEPSNASGMLDLRAKATSALDAAGVDLSGSGVTVDYAGTPRAATPFIGAWEVAASGTLYEDTISDSITLGDSLQNALNTSTSLSQSSSFADIVAPSIMVSNLLSDSNTPTDSIQNTTTMITNSSEVLSLFENNQNSTMMLSILEDGVTSLESLSSVLTILTTISDSLSVDELISVFVALYFTQEDSQSLTDSLSSFATLISNFSDTATFNDTAINSIQVAALVSEAISVFETLTLLQALSAPSTRTKTVPARMNRVLTLPERIRIKTVPARLRIHTR